MNKIIYKVEDKEIELKLDKERNTVWATQGELAKFYNLDRSVIGKYLKEEMLNCTNSESVCANFAHTGTDNKTYNVKHYSLGLILEVGYKIDVNKTLKFKEWASNLLNDYRSVKSFKSPMPVEVFEDGDFKLSVTISPDENTIWLSQKAMAELFGCSHNNISLHIKNILANELESSSVVKDFLTTADDGKNYIVKLYSLDVILSVGYKVNSNRGILFRKWATKILSSYLMKGYAIDENRLTAYKENYIELSNTVFRLENKVDTHDQELNKHNKRITKLESKKKEEINSMIFFKGELYDANSFIVKLVKKANKQLILIDNYIDNITLDILSNKNSNVDLTIITNGYLSNTSITTFNKQYPTLTIKSNNTFHDRFLIIDNKELYLIGSSIKDAGKKCFCIVEIDKDILNKLLVVV